MKPALRKALSTLGALAVVGGVVFAGFRYARSQRPPDLRFETTLATHGDVVAKVTATGTLSALVTVQVGTQVSGRISQLFVDYNSVVKKGQVLAKIDPQIFQASVAQASASYLVAKGNLSKARVQAADAERQYKRAKELAERQLIAQADLDTAQATRDIANATIEASLGSLEQARASLNQAQINLAYTTVISPIDGIVISRSVDVGQTVAASLSAPTLFLIAQDLTKMQVDTSVAEADVGKMNPGMSTTFTVDAYPQEHFKGTIRQIRNAPQNVQNVVTYDAVIDVANPDLKLKPGMTANATVVFAERTGVLVVPNAALRFKPPVELTDKLDALAGSPASGAPSGSAAPDPSALPMASGAPRAAGGGRRNGGAGHRGGAGGPTDRRTVWVLRGELPSPVRVKIGLSDGTLTEIVEGDVKDGEAIVTDATVSADAKKSSAPPGAAPARGGGMRRVF